MAALAVWRRRARGGAPPDAADRRWLLGVVAVAVASHLALDWTNDYGVHVWWPVDDRWAYGDAVFIVEPWLWVAAVPTLALAAGRRAVRVGLWLVLLAALALAWVVPFVGPGSAVAVTLGAGVGAWVARRLAPGRRAAFAVAGWLAVELSGFAGMRAARRQVADAVAAAPRPAGAPAPRLVDVVTTPTPGNPLCARVVAVETDGGRYRVTTAWAAALPGVVAASKCALPEAVVGVSTVPFRPSPRPSTAAVVWRRTWDAPLGELVALARENCVAAAFLRFARVPAWTPLGADSLVVGDLRYDREPGVGFSEFVVARRPAGCPRGVPPWRAPRAGLIGDR